MCTGAFFLRPCWLRSMRFLYLIRPLLWPLDRVAEHARARRFLWIALAAAAGSLLNPYGWNLHAHVFSYLFDSRLASQIAEFQSFNFHDKDATQMAIVMGLAATGRRARSHAEEHRPLSVGRAFPLGRIALRARTAISCACNPAGGQLRHRHRATSNARSAPAPTRSAGRRARLFRSAAPHRLASTRRGFRCRGGRYVAIPFAYGRPFRRTHSRLAAAQTVEKLPANARILSSDSYGGYLIYRFNGSRKVFFDGRSDFYGADFLDQYSTLSAARPGWRGTRGEVSVHARASARFLPARRRADAIGMDNALSRPRLQRFWSPIRWIANNSC